MKHADVIVIGSGLAGLACAHALGKRGKRVLVLEAGGVIGGRTASWTQDGMPVESGLHKFLGIYRALPRLLREAGVDLQKMLTWVDALEIHTADGRRGYFGAAPYRHPLRTIGGMLGNTHLIPWCDKLRLAAMGIRGVTQAIGDPPGLDTVSVTELAQRYGISLRVQSDILRTLTTGVLFLEPERFSAYPTFSPVVEGLKHGMTFGVGAFNGGMTDVMMRPLADAIARMGGAVQTGMRVTRLLTENGTVAGAACGREEIRAEAVVLATALHPAQELIRAAFSDHPWFAPMLRLGTLSAVTIQCETDEPVFRTDHTHFGGTRLCCFAEQSHTTFRHVPGRFSGILFPPDELLEADDDAIRAIAEDDAEKMGFRLRGRITRFRVVRHAHDFYAMQPGTEALRPVQRTPVPGFALAGDYTRQPWSASMEGAVVSGLRAAEAVLS
jgi:15-cis-phytoene desaturase